MGSASMVGLGLATAQADRRVVVITGDGEMLMGLGSLATIGVRRPRNLAVVVIDNALYAETGMQPTHTAHGVDLAAVARACGFAAVKVLPESTNIELAPRDGPYLRSRFRAALLGDAAHR